MAAEGEAVPSHPAPERGNGNAQPSGSQKRRRRGGRGNGSRNAGAGRNRRAEQYDPRRSEPREPAYGQHAKAPAKPVTVTHKKRGFMGMVGALLGRKPENEE